MEVRASEQKHTFEGRPEAHLHFKSESQEWRDRSTGKKEEGEKESERTEESITPAWNRFLQQLSALSLSRHGQLCRHLEDEEQ